MALALAELVLFQIEDEIVWLGPLGNSSFSVIWLENPFRMEAIFRDGAAIDFLCAECGKYGIWLVAYEVRDSSELLLDITSEVTEPEITLIRLD